MSAPVNHRVTETHCLKVGGWVGCERATIRVRSVLRERPLEIEGRVF